MKRAEAIGRLGMAGLGVVLGAVPADAQVPVTVRVGLIPSDFAAQAYYAKDLGFFKKAGLTAELTGLKSGPAIAAAIVSGSLDLGYSNVLSLAIAHDKSFPLVLLAAANMYSADAPTVGLIGVKRTSAINSARDLNGKVMGVAALNNITHIGARAWIDATGGDSSTVRFLEIGISEMAPAVLAGRIDAAVLDQGVYPTLGKPDDPIRVIAHAFDSVGSAFISGGWFSTHDWIAKHPAEAKKFRAAIGEAAVWGNAHHHDSAAIVAKYLNESAEKIDANTRVTYGTSLTAQLLQPSINVAAKYNVIRTAFPAQELIGT